MRIGHGAAAWISHRMDDTSYRALTSSGSESIRLNWVGTMWVFVHLYRSTSASAGSASQPSMHTSVCPNCSALPPKIVTAVW